MIKTRELASSALKPARAEIEASSIQRFWKSAEDISALEAAIEKAPAAGVDPGEVSSAQSRLQQMKERRERAALALKSASGLSDLALKPASCISALEAAIQEALAAGVDPSEVSSAQSRLQQMRER